MSFLKKRPIKTCQTCRWIYQNQEQNSEWFSLRTISPFETPGTNMSRRFL